MTGIDYSVVLGWIVNCSQDLIKFGEDHKRSQRIPFLLLVARRVIIRSRNVKYLVLSYVWGDADLSYHPYVTYVPSMLSERCPAVIEDAITVVLELGYRYL